MYHSSSASASHSTYYLSPPRPNDSYDQPKLPSYPSLPNLRRDGQNSDSRPMVNSPSSLTIANGHSPAALQSHIYTAFLERKTADVALHVRGTWRAIYRLHRVVLIQAGFFQSLFTAGFSESKIKPGGHRLEPDMLDIVLEDPNITRAAFEICIARLYGGGPSLFISPALIATPKYPLTPGFPTSSTRLDPPVISPCPPGQHPASPRFLLSLLATSLFLSIPSVASQAISSILKTVGPTTAVSYLNFAIGKGIGEPDGEEPEAAVGLEGVAEVLKDEEEESLAESLGSPIETPRAMSSAELSEKLKDLDMEFERMAEKDLTYTNHLDVKKEDPSDLASESSHAISQTPRHLEPTLYYGGVSDKIGEATACWLARWGADMLRLEQQDTSSKTTNKDQVSPAPKRNSSTARKRATTIPSDGLLSRSMPTFDPHSIKAISEGSSISAPLIWRRGGLDARWVRGILSSDSLFVQDEKERYDMVRTVVELRRTEGILAEEETEFELLFSKGIYYANMFLDDLMTITKDVSPATGKPNVPINILQSAHWDQSVLRHRITTRPLTSSSPASPTTGTPSASTRSNKEVKELGITVTTPELVSAIARPNPAISEHIDAIHYPVPPDSSTRVGDSTGIEGASMDQLFDVSSPGKKNSDTPGILTSPACEANFFTLQPLQLPVSDILHDDSSGKARWSPYPPFRFAVEFWNVDSLKEKSRLHSRTVWYAGSLWNVYVQVVRKKGVQLGVYLHRQSTVDPIPPSSAPLTLPSSSSLGVPEVGHSSGVPLHQTISVPTVQYSSTRSSTPHSTPSSPAISSSLPTSYSAVNVATSNISVTIPATAPPVSPPQPYRDPRGSVSAYFTIACASATGASLTRFTSAPDAFAVSQSWGWKSSSLRTEEYLEVGEDGMPHGTPAAGKEVSFRATVVLGVV